MEVNADERASKKPTSANAGVEVIDTQQIGATVTGSGTGSDDTDGCVP